MSAPLLAKSIRMAGSLLLTKKEESVWSRRRPQMSIGETGSTYG